MAIDENRFKEGVGKMLKRLFITGISGLLGSNIAKAARGKFKTFGIYFKHPFRMKGVRCFQADLSRAENLRELEGVNPNFIIHCAALTNVDYCEEHPKEAHWTNAVMSSLIAEKARRIGAYFIHISTDAVFDGTKGNYSEENIPNPVNVYGKTKLEAEQSILSILPTACIIRTVIYGWNYQNKLSLAEWMISKLENQERLTTFKDVQFSPILVNDLAEIFFTLEEKKYAGTIHVASRQSCSKFKFALLLAKIFDFKRDLIEPISIDQLNLKAPRGKNNSLDVRRAEKFFGIRLPTVENGLEKMRKLQQNGYINELRNG